MIIFMLSYRNKSQGARSRLYARRVNNFASGALEESDCSICCMGGRDVIVQQNSSQARPWASVLTAKVNLLEDRLLCTPMQLLSLDFL